MRFGGIRKLGINLNHSRMKLQVSNGYELSGSGSNQATRYLARALACAGHEVHVLCYCSFLHCQSKRRPPIDIDVESAHKIDVFNHRGQDML
jgi:hypothetical protein